MTLDENMLAIHLQTAELLPAAMYLVKVNDGGIPACIQATQTSLPKP